MPAEMRAEVGKNGHRGARAVPATVGGTWDIPCRRGTARAPGRNFCATWETTSNKSKIYQSISSEQQLASEMLQIRNYEGRLV